MADMEMLQSLLVPGFSAQEALEILFRQENPNFHPTSLFVEPPPPSVLTDEESGNEDEDGDILHLPGPQLLAPAEVILPIGRAGATLSDDNDLENIIPPLLTPQNSGLASEPDSTLWAKKRLSQKKNNPVWIRGDFLKYEKLFSYPHKVDIPCNPVDIPGMQV